MAGFCSSSTKQGFNRASSQTSSFHTNRAIEEEEDDIPWKRDRVSQRLNKLYGSDEAVSIRKFMGNQTNLTLLTINKDHHTKLQVPSSNGKIAKFSFVHGHPMITRSQNGAKLWEYLVQGHQAQHTGEKAPTPSTMDASKATFPRATQFYTTISSPTPMLRESLKT